MFPTAFLAPTLTAKTCLSALSHKMHFFWPSLRCKVIEQMVKSRYLVEFPAQKKEPKWFQNLGRFKKNSSCSVAKKSPKNWTGPCLSLNMVRRKKVHQVANAIAKCQIFVSRCEPNAAQPNAAVATACQNDDRITYCGGPWIWGWQNCTSRSQKLEPHLLVKVHSASAPWLNYCRSQCNIRLAAEIDIVIFEWQQEGLRKQRLSNSCLKTGAGKAEVEQ